MRRMYDENQIKEIAGASGGKIYRHTFKITVTSYGNVFVSMYAPFSGKIEDTPDRLVKLFGDDILAGYENDGTFCATKMFFQDGSPRISVNGTSYIYGGNTDSVVEMA